ncbi:MAG: GAF domain-containing protein [Pseudomonadota bacterium]
MSKQNEVIEILTKRELEVATIYADGASYKEIARGLGISPTTVRSHLRTVYGKLNITSKIALAQMLADPSEAAAAPVYEEVLTADLALELDEAMRRERMMANVLRIISHKDADLDDVLDEVLDHALEICEAEFGILMAHQGDYAFSEMRSRNISGAFSKWLAEQGLFNPGPETAVSQAARSLTPVSIADIGGEGVSWDENPLRMATVEYGRARSLAAIPMTAGGRLIGVFSVYRTRVHPFNDRALELAQAFADQAAIAIENARQFAAMEARLDQAAATREILEAISGARADEAPVFDLILSRARDLCAADAAILTFGRAGDAAQKLAAAIDMHPATRALYATGKVKMNPDTSIVAAAIVSGEVKNVADYADTDGYRNGDEVFTSLVDDTGMRTSLIVPLSSDGAGIGALVLYRREPRPYTTEQTKLVETFAAQAVIAVENVQQFRAMEARLEQSAATREILQAISHSRDDEGPVFDAILGNARKLCDAPFAALILGRAADGYQSMIAHHGAVQSTEDIYREGRVPMDTERSFAARAIIEMRPVHLPNMMDTDLYRAGVPNVLDL